MVDKNKVFLISALILISLGLLFIYQSQTLGRLRIIFCDVGQGDGMLIISPGGHEVVVDAGAGSKIIDCLSQKMPFWDRKIELMVSTHAQKDHMEGLVEVLERYDVDMVATTGIGNETALYQAWKVALGKEGAKIYTANKGDTLLIDRDKGATLNQGGTLQMTILWPSFAKASEGKPSIEEWRVNPPKDLNETSIVVKLQYGQFCAYLTGDITKEILQGLIDEKCELLKISHHGSRTGTNKEILDLATPEVAVIQVGKNSYGHPTREVLDMLTSKGVKILRNDINGIIEVEVGLRTWQIK